MKFLLSIIGNTTISKLFVLRVELYYNYYNNMYIKNYTISSLTILNLSLVLLHAIIDYSAVIVTTTILIV